MKFYVENPNKRKQVYDILNIFFDHDEILFDEKASLKVLEEEIIYNLSLIHISEPTRQCCTSRMPSSA